MGKSKPTYEELKKNLAEAMALITSLRKTGVDSVISETDTTLMGHRELEEAYIESEQNFRNSMDACPLGIRVVTEDGDLIYSNQAILDICGYRTIEELKQVPRKQLYTPESYAAHQERKEKRNRGEIVPLEYEISIRRPDGTVRNLQVFRKEIIWGGERQFMTMYEDITTRRQAEEALIQSEDMFTKAFRTSPILMAITTEKDGRIIEMNESFCLTAGYSREELVGRTSADINVWQNIEQRNSTIKELQKNGYVKNIEAGLRTRSGEIRKLIFSMSRIILNSEACLVTIASDVTDRNKAEEDLKRSEEKYRSVVALIPDGIVTIDKSGFITTVSKAVFQITGFSEEELVGKHISKVPVLSFKDVSKALAIFGSIIKGTGPMLVEVPCRKKDGTPRIGEFRVSLMKTAGKTTGIQVIARDVTDRNKAEEALKESEERFSTAFQASPNLMAITEFPEGRIIDANPAYCSSTGYGYEELLGHTAAELKMWANPEQRNEFYDKVKKTSRINDFEIDLHAKNGEIKILLLSAEIITLHERSCLLTVALDITERKKAEEELILQRDFNQSMLDTAQAIMLVLDPDGRIQTFNPYLEEISGYKLEEVRGKYWFDTFLPEGDRARIKALFSRTIDDVRTQGTINAIVTKDGREREIEWYDKTLKDLSGKVIGLLAVGQDVTGRRKLEEELARQYRESKLIIDSSHALIFYKDIEGKFLRVNKAFAEALNMTEDQFLGKTVFDLYSADIARGMTDDDREVLDSGQSKLNIIEQYESVTGPRWVQTDKVPILDDKGNAVGLIGFAQDITERRQSEEALKESEERFRALFETMAQGVVYQDAAGSIMSANPAAEKILGITLSQMQGMTSVDPRWKSLREDGSEFPGDQHPSMVALRTGKPVNNVIMGVYNPALDEYRWILISAIPEFKDGESAPYRVYTTFTDITERKRVETALLESEQSYRSTLDNMMEGCQIISPDWHYIYVNDAAAKQGHRKKEELLGHTMMEVYPGIEKTEMFTLLKQCMVERIPHRMENEFVYTESNKGWFELSIQPVPEGIFILSLDITEHKNAEIAIHQSEERFRRIFQEGPLGIVLSNLEYKFTMMNARFCQMNGYSEKELLSMTFKDISFPEDVKDNLPNLQKLARGELTYYSTEKRYKKKSGDFFWGSLTVTLLSDNSGKPLGFLAMVEDITQRKQAEENMAYLASYPEFNPEPVMELDPQGNIRYVNPAAFKAFPDLSTLGTKHPYLANWAQVVINVRNGTPRNTIMREVTVDDSFYEQEIYAVTENQIRLYGKNVTQRKHDEERINHLNLTLRSIRNVNQLITREKNRDRLIKGICDNLVVSRSFHSAWIVLLDDSRRPVTWADANTGSGFPAMIESFKRGELPRCAQKALKQKQVFVTQDPYVMCAGCPLLGEAHKIGSMTVRLEIEGNIYGILCASMPRNLLSGQDEISLFNEVAADIAFAVRDIELGASNELLQQERLRAAKLESIGTLAGGIAHDFNNLLTGIMGNIGMVKANMTPSDNTFEMLDEAEKAAARARDLTQQLLTFARGGKPIKKVVNIARLIKESASFALRGSKLRLELSIPDDLWLVEADEGQLGQVINNLVINADEAMPTGGILKINAMNYAITRVVPLPLSRGKYVQIDIADSGIGISPEHLQRIFEPYFSTKQKGSGLGLTTAYSIIKNHGGSLLTESVLNKGSVFHIYLPASKKTAKGEKKVAAARSTQAGGKILVMDDDEIIRKMLKTMLTLAGYEAELTADGAEALEKYKKAMESRDPFSAVIMDLTIPGGMGGKEAVKKLLEIDPQAAVIVSSGYTTDSIMSEYKKYGFSAVIAKPYSTRQLQDTLTGLPRRKKKK